MTQVLVIAPLPLLLFRGEALFALWSTQALGGTQQSPHGIHEIASPSLCSVQGVGKGVQPSQ